MKCIRCGTDNKLKDRTDNNGCCKQCKHRFVFDPKSESGTEMNFTDPFFASVLTAVSAQDSLYFTPRQIYYLFNDRYVKRKKTLTGAGCLLIVAAVVFFFLAGAVSPFFFLLSLAALIGGILLLLPPVQRRLRARQPKETAVSSEQLNRWLERWSQVNGPLAKLLPPPAPQQAPAQVSSEVTAYSFDRVVICQHAAVAQFLIANNFHFEHNCAVLSLNRYPQSIFDTVMEMLRRNPELSVYALHDASFFGVQMGHRLMTDERWFRDFPNVRMIDLGLMPRQVLNRSVFVRQAAETGATNIDALAAPIRESLQPDELKWLAEGKAVELESLSPQRLLQMLTLGIAKSRDPQATDALVPVEPGYYPGSSMYVYSSDSFG